MKFIRIVGRGVVRSELSDINVSQRSKPREMGFAAMQLNSVSPVSAETILCGPCWVIDGDTIVIDKVHIRLAGIDAPELDHPWGQQSKWALVKLCRGQVVTAHVRPELSYDRVVAECFLPDGRDIAAEMVRAGLALDWPKFSGGRYSSLETEDARRKLWRAALRQRGLPPPQIPAPPRALPASDRIRPPDRRRLPQVSVVHGRRKAGHWLGWLVVPSMLALMVGCSLVRPVENSNTEPAGTASALTRFAVTAEVLNVRERPSPNAAILTQISQRTHVIPQQMSQGWYAIELSDGRIGWVHSQFLERVDHYVPPLDREQYAPGI